MTSFVVRDATHLGADRIAASTTAFALYENLKAVLEKDPTAVAAGWILANGYVVEAMIAALAVTEGKLGASSVSQGKLKTTTGIVSTAGTTHLVLPGGQYGFYPQTGMTGAGSQFNAHLVFGGGGSGFASNIYLSVTAGGDTAQALQRYIQSSPPYNLGDGEVPLFVFALVDSLGKVIATYVAEDPPWAYNGPTNIVPDFMGPDGKQYIRQVIDRKVVETELTQEIKQTDMRIIPHPFLGNDLTGKTVVLLDPVSDTMEQFRTLNRAGDSISNRLYDGDIIVDNVPLSRASPVGVKAVGVRLR